MSCSKASCRRSCLTTLRRRIEEIFIEEGDRAGAEFKQEPQTRRLANLVNRGEIFQRVIALPRILEYVAYVLGPEFKLQQPQRPLSQSILGLGATASLRRRGGAGRDGLLGVQFGLVTRRFHYRERGHPYGSGIASLGQITSGCAAGPAGASPGSGAVDRPCGRRSHHEYSHVARRHRQSHGRAPSRPAQLLLPVGQTAAAVSKTTDSTRRYNGV